MKVMKIVFAGEPIPEKIEKSIFLAGPSPRSNKVLDWRYEAVVLLNCAMQFDGTLFIPIPRDRFYEEADTDNSGWTYTGQIEWECKARAVADCIMFWVDRDIKGEMPGFTTNIEFGEDLNSGKIVYGRPDSADKIRYMDERMKDIGPVYMTLGETLVAAVNKVGKGSLRVGGEVNVPLFIWESEQFQKWYASLKENGNRLDDAKVLQSTRLPNGYLFSFMLWVKVWITSENRYKENEFIFSRTDISTVVPYFVRGENKHVVMVSEFRSPVRNIEGKVFELPGGSAAKPGVDPRENAAHELEEETGIKITDLDRFKFVFSKQVCATLSTHCAHVYSVKLTDGEIAKVVDSVARGTVYGVEADSERTTLDIVCTDSLLWNPNVDAATTGMIAAALSLHK